MKTALEVHELTEIIARLENTVALSRDEGRAIQASLNALYSLERLLHERGIVNR